MDAPITREPVGGWQRAFCLAVALTLCLMCAVFAVGGSMQMSSGQTSSVGAEGEGAVHDATTGVVMGSMCEGVCAADTGDVCAIAAAMTVTTLLWLLLWGRRITFLGLMTRKALAPQWPGWCFRSSGPSLTELSVLRV